MVKNILIVILMILSIALVSISYNNADQATEQKMAAQEIRDQAALLQMEADFHKERAIEAAAEADHERANAEVLKSQLLACQSKE